MSLAGRGPVSWDAAIRDGDCINAWDRGRRDHYISHSYTSEFSGTDVALFDVFS